MNFIMTAPHTDCIEPLDKPISNQQRIWQVVSQIPAGRVASYGQVARLADLPGYARYVGYVMKNLPAGTALPWHRVVNSQGRLSFPVNSAAYRRQKSLLEREGIVFSAGQGSGSRGEGFSMQRFGWPQDEA